MPLKYGVLVPLKYGVLVPLKFGALVPLHYGVLALRVTPSLASTGFSHLQAVRRASKNAEKVLVTQ